MHVGDWTGTLIGPWFEAAMARDALGGLARCLNPGSLEDHGEQLLRRRDALIVSSHGYYAGGVDGRFGEVAVGTGEMGVADIAVGRFGAPRVAVLAACDSGVNYTHLSENNGTSVPSMLLHSGVELVLAPVSPVDDLVSALLVTGYIHLIRRGTDAVQAAELALNRCHEMSLPDLESWLGQTIDAFEKSEFKAFSPWSSRLVYADCLRRVRRLAPKLSYELEPFIITRW